MNTLDRMTERAELHLLQLYRSPAALGNAAARRALDVHGALEAVAADTAAALCAVAEALAGPDDSAAVCAALADADRWPWDGPVEGVRAARALDPMVTPDDHRWPPGAPTPAVLWAWAGERGGWGSLDGKPWPSGTAPAPDLATPLEVVGPAGHRVPLPLLAHLLASVQECRREQVGLRFRFGVNPRPVGAIPFGADKTSRRVAECIAGQVPPAPPHEGRAVIAQWADNRGQYDLWTQPTTEAGLLPAIGGRWGSSTMLHVCAATTLHWASGAKVGQGFPWFPGDHRWILGLGEGNGEQSDSGARARMKDALKSLECAHLTATYPDKEKIPGPLGVISHPLTNGKGDILGGTMMLHPAVVEAVSGGGYWWPAPLRLLRMLPGSRAPVGGVVTLAVLMAQQWSTAVEKRQEVVFTLRMPGLLECLRASVRGDRQTDNRAQKRAADALGMLQDAGFVDRWEVVDGGTVKAWPGVAKSRRGKKPERWPTLPSTGDSLATWLSMKGWSKAHAARMLGVTSQTIRRGVKRGPRLISGHLRAALRSLLWLPAVGTPKGV